MSNPSRMLVYGLLNPIDEELFYIGQTRKRREFRLLEHIEQAVGGSGLPVHSYIRRLFAIGRIPSIFVIERIGGSERADEAERKWIRYFADDSAFKLPLVIHPQTPKSQEIMIRAVSLSNIRHVPASHRD